MTYRTTSKKTVDDRYTPSLILQRPCLLRISNVQLMLSTGQPTRNTQARVPAVWNVDLYTPQPVTAPVYPAAAPVAAPAAMDGKMLAEAAPELPQLDDSFAALATAAAGR